MLGNFCFANSILGVSESGFWEGGNSQLSAPPTVGTKAVHWKDIRGLLVSPGRLENEVWRRKSEAAGRPALVLGTQTTGLRGWPP